MKFAPLLTRGLLPMTRNTQFITVLSIIAFSKGKLTKVASSISETKYTAFDLLGKVLSSQQITDGQTYISSYVYSCKKHRKLWKLLNGQNQWRTTHLYPIIKTDVWDYFYRLFDIYLIELSRI